MLAPLAPHIAEMWEALGHARTLAYEPWPTHDPALTREDTVEIVVQLDGKMRSQITLPADSQAQTIGSQRVRTDHRPSRQTGAGLKNPVLSMAAPRQTLKAKPSRGTEPKDRSAQRSARPVPCGAGQSQRQGD